MKVLNYFLAFFVLGALVLISCEDEPDPILAPVISSIIAEGTSFEDGSAVSKDLNGAASASDVALNSVIMITLDKAVDGSTVNVSNVSISDGMNDLASTVSSTGASITITPGDEMVRGTQHTLTISGVQSSDGATLATVTRTFTTEGRAPVVVPKAEDQIAYWNFDGQMMDQVGTYNPDNSVGIEFGTDRFGQANSTATFDGDVSIIEVPGADALMESDSWATSFWMKSNSLDHVNADGNETGMFVMGLGAFHGFQWEIGDRFENFRIAASYSNPANENLAETLFFNGEEQNNENGGWQGTTFTANLGEGGIEDLIKDKWIQAVFSFDATSKIGSMFINGELMESFDFNLWPDGGPKQSINRVNYDSNEEVEPILAFGFIKSIDSPKWADTPWGDYNKPTSKHFKGDLDDIRVWRNSLTPDEVKSLYDAEK